MDETFEFYATQYLRPNGIIREIHTNLPIKYLEKVTLLKDKGFSVALECISEEAVSVTIEHRAKEADYCTRVSRNLPNDNNTVEVLCEMLDNITEENLDNFLEYYSEEGDVD